MKTKRGFLLMNTGSPDEPTERATRAYLKESLTDQEVDQPAVLREMMRHSALHPHKSERLASAYRSIWTEEGSPLLGHCKKLVKSLKAHVDDPIEFGMAYGRPSYKDALEKLLFAEVEEIGLLPMFPQYALSTFGVCVRRVKAELKRLKSPVRLRVVRPFFEESAYLEALTESIKDSDEYVLFSYQGYPKRHLKRAQHDAERERTHDHCMSSATCCSECSTVHETCYRHQCLKTSREAARAAHIPAGRFASAFTTHDERNEYMMPVTDEMLVSLPKQGVTKLAVVCPSSYCDDIETLDQLSVHARKVFMGAGGQSFRTVPCPNHTAASQHCMEALIGKADQWPVVEL